LLKSSIFLDLRLLSCDLECDGNSIVSIFIAPTQSDITSDIAQLRQVFELKPTRIMSHTTVCCGGVEM